ncbi:MAG: MBL fold metallo-hydrolase [Marinobacter sp.]|uniref:MBL fold metallo-hydrolase n=1 Tax=Marinobacter sp. TaxID=50741 RepID=UPI0032981B5F
MTCGFCLWEEPARLVITHAHEDHIGAVPYLWPLLQCPIYTSRFTAEILRRKLAEFDLLHRVPIHVVEVGDRRTIGPFEVEWLALTHSIPDPNALMIRTPAGRIFHSGDWKLDDHPLTGRYRPSPATRRPSTH